MFIPFTWIETFRFKGYNNLYAAMEQYERKAYEALEQMQWPISWFPISWGVNVLERSITTKPSVKVEIVDGTNFAGFPVTPRPFPRSPYHYFTLDEPELLRLEVISRLYVKNGAKWVKYSSILSGKVEVSKPKDRF